jgi:hypothetical protein
MFRHTLLIGAGLAIVATAAHAQNRKREDLLDALTTHIQICAEISDPQARLGCYDKLQTRVGDVQTPSPSSTPLTANSGSGLQPTPLDPPPLMVPGGGAATLGSGYQSGTLQPPTSNPDAAFDSRAATSGYRPPEGAMAKPQPLVRRSGPRAIPAYGTPQPLVTLAANNLTYNDARYWQVNISITSTVARTQATQVQCTFLNAGRPVGDAYFGPTDIAAGEQITTEMVGPPTTAYVDSTNCRLLSP